jgi:hypothetical protein
MTREAPAMRYISGECRKQLRYPETGFETITPMKDHTERRGEEAASMAHRKTAKRSKARSMLRLADLEQSKNAVFHSLGAASSQESYGHAIDEFVGWYCSEPRLAFNRTVVLRHRFFLEQKNLAPSTINVRLAAVRRLAYEASDSGLLSPDLAAGIRRVKGAKCLGARIGNWLTVDQSRSLLGDPLAGSLRGKRGLLQGTSKAIQAREQAGVVDIHPVKCTEHLPTSLGLCRKLKAHEILGRGPACPQVVLERGSHITRAQE